MSHVGEIILGLLGSGFFTLLWRRLDKVDARLDQIDKEAESRFIRVEGRLQQIGDVVMEVKGRMDEISKHV